MNTFNKLALAGTMALASMTVQAAAISTAEIDWSNVVIQTTGNLTYSLDIYDDVRTQDRNSMIVVARSNVVQAGSNASYTYIGADGRVGQTRNDEVKSRTYVKTESGEIRAQTVSWGALTIDGNGTFSMTIPYALSKSSQDEGPTTARVQAYMYEKTGADYFHSDYAVLEGTATSKSGYFTFNITPDGSASSYEFDTVVYADAISAVPEPETYALFGIGLTGIAIARRRRPC